MARSRARSYLTLGSTRVALEPRCRSLGLSSARFKLIDPRYAAGLCSAPRRHFSPNLSARRPRNKPPLDQIAAPDSPLGPADATSRDATSRSARQPPVRRWRRGRHRLERGAESLDCVHPCLLTPLLKPQSCDPHCRHQKDDHQIDHPPALLCSRQRQRHNLPPSAGKRAHLPTQPGAARQRPESHEG
jgi:hypothetical protein